MKYFIPSLLCIFFAATFMSCGSDDDSLQYQYHSLSIRTDNLTNSLPAGSSGGTSSNTFVATIDHSGRILPQHVGTATIEAIGNRIKYTYTVEVTPVKRLFTDLGIYVNKNKSEIEKESVLGAPISSAGYKYEYAGRQAEKGIQVQYNEDYTVGLAILTIKKDFYSETSEQINEYYSLYKVHNGYSVYINANTFNEATIVLARNQIDNDDRLIYMSPSTYLLWEITSQLPG